jgi:hypothetical protein
MQVDPNLRQIFSRSIFPSNISQNPSNDELRCLSLNHHAFNILVDSLSRGAYFAIMIVIVIYLLMLMIYGLKLS